MKTVLVTGAGGQLGKCIQKRSNQHPNLEFHFKTSNELDITNEKKLQAYFQKHHIDCCINCAAYTKVDQAEEEVEKAFAVNAEAVKNFAKMCHEYNITLIHISTDYVFDGKKTTPYNENDSTNPINVYGASKLRGEEYIKAYTNAHYIVRTSWLYSEFGKNFYNTILQKAIEKATLSITTAQKGTPTNANDLAEFLLKLITKENVGFGTYHFSNLGKATWFDFAKAIITNLNLPENEQPILQKSDNYPTKAARPENSILDKSKALQHTEIDSWKESLQKLMQENF